MPTGSRHSPARVANHLSEEDVSPFAALYVINHAEIGVTGWIVGHKVKDTPIWTFCVLVSSMSNIEFY
jgi:hypothetical protein